MSDVYINPEYSVTDENQYLPQNSFSYKRKGTKLMVINNMDGSNGVTLYDGDDQVVKVLIDGNAELTADKSKREATLKVKGDKIIAGEGVVVEENEEEGTKTVSQDTTWLKTFVEENCVNKIKGENGVLVHPDEEDEKTTIIELDDNYIINQGEF